MNEIQLRTAKATLSAVIDKARDGEPSVITRHGKPEAVVVRFEDRKRLSTFHSFADMLLRAPIDDDTIQPWPHDKLNDPIEF